MKLERVSVEGFESASQKIEVDFRDKNMVVFVGSNGSGKSLLSIWAPLFALYGKVRHRVLNKAISTSSGQANVEVDFEVNGNHYRVIRKLPRTGRQEATLYHLNDNDEWEPITNGDVKATNPKIIELIGVDYDSACATFVAQQGKYGLFNEGKPSERREILSELLNLTGYEEFKEKADARYKESNVQVAALESRIEEIEMLREVAHEGNPEFKEQDDAELSEILAELMEQEEEQRSKDAAESWKREHADQTLADAKEAVARWNREHQQSIKSTQESIKTLEDSYKSNLRGINDLEAELAQIEEAKLHYKDAEKSKTALEKRITKGQAFVERVTNELQGIQDKGNESRAKQSTLTSQIEDLKENRSTLVKSAEHNAECVTCKQPLPDDVYKRVLHQFDTDIASTEDALAEVDKQINELLAAFKKKKAESNSYAEYLSQYQSNLQEIRETLARVQSVIGGEERVQKRLASAREVINGAQSKADGYKEQLTTLQAQTVPQGLLDAVESAQKNVDQVEAERKAPSADDVSAQNLLANKISAIQKELHQREMAREKEVALDARQTKAKEELKTAKEDEKHYDILRKEFAPTGIPAMIMAGCLQELEDDANEYLERLSAGSLTINLETQSETQKGKVNEEILVTVNAPDGTRDYSSFSGGQKFRIDLAMRAAMCKVSARRNGSAAVETFFIDEGFGYLDEEGKQSVMGALTALSEEMMIVGVSHIQGVKDGFDTIFETSIDTGYTTIKQIAG